MFRGSGSGPPGSLRVHWMKGFSTSACLDAFLNLSGIEYCSHLELLVLGTLEMVLSGSLGPIPTDVPSPWAIPLSVQFSTLSTDVKRHYRPEINSNRSKSIFFPNVSAGLSE